MAKGRCTACYMRLHHAATKEVTYLICPDCGTVKAAALFDVLHECADCEDNRMRTDPRHLEHLDAILACFCDDPSCHWYNAELRAEQLERDRRADEA